MQRRASFAYRAWRYDLTQVRGAQVPPPLPPPDSRAVEEIRKNREVSGSGVKVPHEPGDYSIAAHICMHMPLGYLRRQRRGVCVLTRNRAFRVPTSRRWLGPVPRLRLHRLHRLVTAGGITPGIEPGTSRSCRECLIATYLCRSAMSAVSRGEWPPVAGFEPAPGPRAPCSRADGRCRAIQSS